MPPPQDSGTSVSSPAPHLYCEVPVIGKGDCGTRAGLGPCRLSLGRASPDVCRPLGWCVPLRGHLAPPLPVGRSWEGPATSATRRVSSL